MPSVYGYATSNVRDNDSSPIVIVAVYWPGGVRGLTNE